MPNSQRQVTGDSVSLSDAKRNGLPTYLHIATVATVGSTRRASSMHLVEGDMQA